MSRFGFGHGHTLFHARSQLSDKRPNSDTGHEVRNVEAGPTNKKDYTNACETSYMSPNFIAHTKREEFSEDLIRTLRSIFIRTHIRSYCISLIQLNPAMNANKILFTRIDRIKSFYHGLKSEKCAHRTVDSDIVNYMVPMPYLRKPLCAVLWNVEKYRVVVRLMRSLRTPPIS